MNKNKPNFTDSEKLENKAKLMSIFSASFIVLALMIFYEDIFHSAPHPKI